MKIYQIKTTREDNSQEHIAFYKATIFRYNLWDLIDLKQEKINKDNEKEVDGKRWFISEIKRINQ